MPAPVGGQGLARTVTGERINLDAGDVDVAERVDAVRKASILGTRNSGQTHGSGYADPFGGDSAQAAFQVTVSAHAVYLPLVLRRAPRSA